MCVVTCVCFLLQAMSLQPTMERPPLERSSVTVNDRPQLSKVPQKSVSGAPSAGPAPAPGAPTGQQWDDKGSIMAKLTDDLNGYAQTASNTLSEIFGEAKCDYNKS